MIEVRKSDLTNPLYDDDDIKRACGMLNDVLGWFDSGAYAPGVRNNMAVDLGCLCHVLGLDATTIVDSYLTPTNKADLVRRLNVIDDYMPYWDRNRDGVFDMMVMQWDENALPDYVVLV